jgi:translation initiation factor 2B subunit (eIF-2B alpha/beta/delta family)
MITLKRSDSDSEPKDITDLDSQVRRIYADLIRLEPLRRAMGAGKSLDMMFIIDCTGSMGSWINTCKQEIKAIIDCVRNQHFNIKIRISIIAYRDHCDGEKISEVFSFSDDIAACQKFLK